ncbi:coiled-coil domain-containing protein 43 [Anthonomus grandis grandis]|uniref:coiled-coil domain-containing protein 43 n=1 Tax=Anthonomus grandis grandis TaxID=2921223 RepID=UPI0021663E15|nr:coiled-coil domain-containing protein 43 [Anthonomus grandis grandis]
MAAAVADNIEFTTWLDKKLQELNTDEEVFGSYIQGILDSDETSDEKSEALQGILAEIVENGSDITKICDEILEQWQLLKPKESPSSTQCADVDLNEKLAKLLESQSLATTKQKKYTEEEKKIREAILAQYSQMTDSEEDEEEGATADPKPKETLEKNINAQLVQEAEKQKREQSRLDSQKKKEKDKEDREKQKQLREEKKEKRKTQKGERKR